MIESHRYVSQSPCLTVALIHLRFYQFPPGDISADFNDGDDLAGHVPKRRSGCLRETPPGCLADRNSRARDGRRPGLPAAPGSPGTPATPLKAAKQRSPTTSSSENISDRPVRIDEAHIGPDDRHAVIDGLQYAHLTFFAKLLFTSKNHRQNVQTGPAIVKRLITCTKISPARNEVT